MEEKVVGYVRVSTEGQVSEGYSLTYQVEEIERYCIENKLQLLHIYEDKGISGAKVDEDGLTVEREGLQGLLSGISYHQVSKVNEVVARALNKMDINQSIDSLQKQVYDLQKNSRKLQGNALPLYPSQGATVELWERKLKQLEIQNK